MKHNVLKNWEIIKRYDGAVVIRGEIYNDIKGRFSDGTTITTSRVLNADFIKGIVETKNSVYRLEY